MGSVLPYLSVFLEQRGLTMGQIGWVLSLTGVAVVVTPVVTAALADTRVQGRTLLGLMFAGSGLSLAWLAGLSGGGYWPLLIAHGLFALAFAPVTSLQDGLYFQRRSELETHGQTVQDYHHVRVFGTFGFIVPSLVLYFVLRHESVDTAAAVWCGAVCCGVGALNAILLPKTRRDRADDPIAKPKDKLPTAAAFRALTEPHVLVFCVAMLLIHLAIAAYYGFYPVYLTKTIGLDARWIGLISNLGVVVEIGFMLGFGWFLRHWGVRKLMIIGAGCMALRFALLGFLPGVGVAIGTQVFHGIMVLVVHVAPPIYLNRRADAAYRNSIQGLYAMAVFGTGRIAGNLIAGWIADVSLTAVFIYSMGLTLGAMALFVFAFADAGGEG